MPEHRDTPEWKSSSRGEAAWKETRERVAARNTEARKQGKVERDGYEQDREDARRNAAAVRHARLLSRDLP
jgi:hypothetical protein